MCFTRKPYDKVRANIAKEDIFAYKWLSRSNSNKPPHSPFYFQHWVEDKVYSEKDFQKELKENEKTIEAGFHSLRDINEAVEYKDSNIHHIDVNIHLYKVCIPKGSYYYMNGSQIVSNKCYLVSSKAVRIRKK